MPDSTLSLLRLWLTIDPASAVAHACHVGLPVLCRALNGVQLAPTHAERIAAGVARVREKLEAAREAEEHVTERLHGRVAEMLFAASEDQNRRLRALLEERGVKVTPHLLQARQAACPERDRAISRFSEAAERQSCKVCGAVSGLEYVVTDEMWARVVPESYKDLVCCLDCFDAFAADKEIDWRPGLTFLAFVGERLSLPLLPPPPCDDGNPPPPATESAPAPGEEPRRPPERLQSGRETTPGRAHFRRQGSE